MLTRLEISRELISLFAIEYILQAVTFFFFGVMCSSFDGELSGSFLITGEADRKLDRSSGFFIPDSWVFNELDNDNFLGSTDECDRWWCLLASDVFTSEEDGFTSEECFLTSDDEWVRWCSCWWRLFGSDKEEDDSRCWCLLLLPWWWSFWPDCLTSLLWPCPEPGSVDDLCELWPGFASPDDLCELLLCEWCLWPSDFLRSSWWWPSDDLDRSWDECDLWWCDDDDDDECLETDIVEWWGFEGCKITNNCHHQNLLVPIIIHPFHFMTVPSFNPNFCLLFL